MKVLIVDDNDNKINEIIKVFNKKNWEIDISTGSVDAIEKLRKTEYDLLILDLIIPKVFGADTANLNNSIDLLERIKRGKKLIEPKNKVALTADINALKQGNPTFSSAFIEIIKYDLSSREWRDNLFSKIEMIEKSAPKYYQKRGYLYDFAIIAALNSPELDAVKQVFPAFEPINIEGDTSYYFEVKLTNGKKILLATNNQMGMVAMSQFTEKIIQTFRPRNICMSGIAAGVKGEVNLGDIMVSRESWNYDSGKFIGGSFKPDFSSISIREELVSNINKIVDLPNKLFDIKNKYTGLKPEHELRMKIGPVASGASVVADSEILKRPQNLTRKLLGVEMEIYGMYFSCKHTSTPRPENFLAVKSVCDFADADKNDRFQDYAAYTSARFLKIIIEEGVFDSEDF